MIAPDQRIDHDTGPTQPGLHPNGPWPRRAAAAHRGRQVPLVRALTWTGGCRGSRGGSGLWLAPGQGRGGAAGAHVQGRGYQGEVVERRVAPSARAGRAGHEDEGGYLVHKAVQGVGGCRAGGAAGRPERASANRVGRCRADGARGWLSKGASHRAPQHRWIAPAPKRRSSDCPGAGRRAACIDRRQARPLALQ